MDSEGQNFDEDQKKAIFLGTEKIDKVLVDLLLENGITKKVKKSIHPGFYVYDGLKIEAKLETSVFGKIMLLVRPVDEDYIDGVYVPFREWTEQRGDIDPSKAYFHDGMNIYNPGQIKHLKESWVKVEDDEEAKKKRYSKRKSVAPKTKKLSIANEEDIENGHLGSGVNQASFPKSARKQTV